MVFRTFDNVSYALVMQGVKPVRIQRTAPGCAVESTVSRLLFTAPKAPALRAVVDDSRLYEGGLRQV